LSLKISVDTVKPRFTRPLVLLGKGKKALVPDTEGRSKSGHGESGFYSISCNLVGVPDEHNPIIRNFPLQKVADDVVLEIVRFVGNVVRNDDCAQLFANAGLPNTLIELITAKQV
jgi:hypothetical protein